MVFVIGVSMAVSTDPGSEGFSSVQRRLLVPATVVLKSFVPSRVVYRPAQLREQVLVPMLALSPILDRSTGVPSSSPSQ
jgi:hypothetical protein